MSIRLLTFWQAYDYLRNMENHYSQQEIYNLWAGKFGDEYTARSLPVNESRQALRGVFIDDVLFRSGMLPQPKKRVLEIGVGDGSNFTCTEHWQNNGITRVGIDINQSALDSSEDGAFEPIKFSWAPGKPYPFPDNSFDLVFTTGLLMHIVPSLLPEMIREMGRLSNTIMVAEYFSAEEHTVKWRGMTGVLWERDYGKALYDALPETWRCEEYGCVRKSVGGFQNLDWWIFKNVGSMSWTGTRPG